MRISVFVAAMLTACCAIADEQPAPKNPAVDASNAFACDLFKKLVAENAGKNLFFSPYSISSALAMTMEGARSDTAREMGDVLRLPASLRRDAPNQPWLTGPYSAGFGDFHRRLGGGVEPAKAEATRKKVAELRAQLKMLNDQLVVIEKQGKFEDFNREMRTANALAASINSLAKQVDQFDLRVANGLWGEKTYPFKSDYVNAVDKLFGSGRIRPADFINNYSGERATINRWVEEQTNDRIKNLLPKLPPAQSRRLRLVLVNAIYFKGEWSLPFDEKRTTDETFFQDDGAKVKVKTPMMHMTHGSARYAAFNGDGSFFGTPMTTTGDGKVASYPDEKGFLIAELPFKGDKLAMVVIAPRTAGGLPAIEAKLSGENLAAWLGKLQQRTVHVAMPRFKMETDYALVDTLKGMGMKKAFLPGVADFSAMSASSDPEDRLFISHVLHKAFVEVNEKGAEAAAATVVMMMKGDSAPASVPFTPEFRADRPFLFLIRDIDSGMVLFVGRMTQPA